MVLNSWRAIGIVAASLRVSLANINETVFSPDDGDATTDDDFLSVPSWALPASVVVLLALLMVGSLAGSPLLQSWCRIAVHACLKKWHLWQSACIERWRASRCEHLGRSVSPVNDDCETGCKVLEDEHAPAADVGGHDFAGVLPSSDPSGDCSIVLARKSPDPTESTRDGEEPKPGGDLGSEQDAHAQPPVLQDGASSLKQEASQPATSSSSKPSSATKLSLIEDAEPHTPVEEKQRNYIVDRGNVVLLPNRGRQSA